MASREHRVDIATLAHPCLNRTQGYPVDPGLSTIVGQFDGGAEISLQLR